ncbi:E3 ubiquitin-protein ligase COP1-like isoform X2 [Schistocerca cancellata]|uniref:E3 ubiquitin-protein ligase COP1-like isoform X2 n=1 Tax=Schistocerca cancellata TaxID=274614 RepID=UPI002118652D|nr:E3 ubiquitin-protein ligase COP1-like isoform X2 [Schistocerca cancellata]
MMTTVCHCWLLGAFCLLINGGGQCTRSGQFSEYLSPMASGKSTGSIGSASSSSTPQRSRPTKRQHSVVLNGVGGSFEDKSSDYLCPVCFELIEEAHITRCGHTFCYRCISKSVESCGRCPKCGFSLSSREQVFPNFLLNELVSKYKSKVMGTSEAGLTRDASGESLLGPDGLRDFVATESLNLTLPDVNVILEVLTQRKHLLEAESCAAQNKLLYEFLTHLLQQKEEQLSQLTREVALIKRDIGEVENILKEVHTKCPKLEKEPSTSGSTLGLKKELSSEGPGKLSKEESMSEAMGPDGFTGSQKNLDSSATSLALRRKRMHAHFDDFVQCYFNSRAKELMFGGSMDKSFGGSMDKSFGGSMDKSFGGSIDRTAMPSSESQGLNAFRENLVKFSRYNSLRPLATLNYSSDIFNNSTIVSSIEFDKDNEFFAIAGVTKRIKVFDYGAVIRDTVDIHYPCVEMVSNSKISCVSWNSYHKSTLASSDYEGTVTVWDAVSGQRVKTFQEHEKRCWSVDFNDVDTRLIASGSDDARVKLWSLNIDRSVASLEAKANVCCVKFNPRSSCHLAFGSADHCVHYYDLRNMKEPLSVFKGHRKAVSYVKFLNKEEIVSASTDSQLKMWNINNPHCLRSFVGHINEKNFVGLATDGDYVACGSENNALYVYYKGLTKQLFSFKFDAVKSVLEKDRKEDDVNEFVSAVCWRQHSNIVVAANSQGIIKILELV